MLSAKIPDVQQALAQAGLDGWLFAVFQHNDPVSLELLGFAERQLVTRRCYYLVPAAGEPAKLVHRLEPAMLDHLPGTKASYLTWGEHRQALAELVAGRRRLAAQYSPECALPTVSRLDAGTAELLRAFGVELATSAELVQTFAATWSPEQAAGHRRAATALHEIVHAAFARTADALRAGRTIDEYAVQQFIVEQFERRDLWTEADPIVAVNAHSADPHYQPGPQGSWPIRPGDFLLIDLWAKEKTAASVYADITWCGVGAPAPEPRHQRVFEIVRDARDAGWELVAARWPAAEIRGFEVDDATRAVIVAAGYGEQFIHRTGHSITSADHGPGANMDNLETHDTRRLTAMTGFSIEPGIYLEGDFGVRLEIDVALTPEAAEITGGEPQRELIRLLG